MTRCAPRTWSPGRIAPSATCPSRRTRETRPRSSTTSSTVRQRLRSAAGPRLRRSRQSTRVSGEELDRRLAAASDSTILLNHVIHHGGLGHHVQNAHAYAVGVAHRTGRGRRRGQPHRDVLRRHGRGRLGLLRLRPGRGDRPAVAARAGGAAAHARAPGRARRGRPRPAHGRTDARRDGAVLRVARADAAEPPRGPKR